jgi:outer membrane receptor protein involved in Fe transport
VDKIILLIVEVKPLVKGLEQIPPYTLRLKKGHIDSGDYLLFFTRYSYTKTAFIPRLAFIVNLNRRNVFKLLYGEAINRPSFFQMAEEGYFPPFELAKPEPKTIRTLELNYVGQLFPGWSLSVNAGFFYNMLDHLIYRTMTVIDGLYKSYYDNVGKMTTTGVELTVQAAQLDEFTIELRALYQHAVVTRYRHIEPGYSPRFLGYLKAFYSFNRDIKLAVTGNYVGSMAS